MIHPIIFKPISFQDQISIHLTAIPQIKMNQKLGKFTPPHMYEGRNYGPVR